MVITLTGSNILRLRQRLDELVNKFIAEHGELAVERLDAADTSLETTSDSVQSLPFLSAKKMVILREPSANKQISESIEQLISSTSESTELIIYEPEPDKRTAYFKSLQKLTNLEQFSELDVAGLARWLSEEAAAHGGELSTQDANYLVERVGGGQQLLSQELEKLLLYDKKITRQNIDSLTDATPQGKIFDLLDAAFGDNKPQAIRLYEDQRAQKVEPQAIMAMLIWQLNLITLAKLGGNRSSELIAADSGIKPYPIKKASALAAKLSNEKLRQMVGELLEIDVMSKTTSINLDEALKTYITTL